MKKRSFAGTTTTTAIAFVFVWLAGLATVLPCVGQNVPITGLADGAPPQPLDAFIFQRPGSQRANKILWAEIAGELSSNGVCSAGNFVTATTSSGPTCGAVQPSYIANSIPFNSAFLITDGTGIGQWATMAGDLNCTVPGANSMSCTVGSIKGFTVDAGTPLDRYIWQYRASGINEWIPTSNALASFTFANQGTTTTVLHGNGSGAPAWGPVSNADLSLSSPLTVVQGGTGLATAADDTILIGNATAYSATAIPLCTDTSGNHLNYSTSTNSFSCGTSSSTTSAGWTDLGTTVALNTITDSVGIGTNSAPAKLTVNGNAASTAPSALAGTVLQVTGADNTTPGIEINGYGTGSRSALSLRRALGTLASSAQITTASILGELDWYGYTNSSAWSGVAGQIICEAAENFTSSANGTNCYILTTAQGSTTLTRNLQVTGAGDIRVLTGALAQYKVSVTATVANTTLTSSTSGVSYNNSGASGQIIFTLPACTAGLIYEFTVSTAQNLRVVAVGTDKIYDGSLASAAAGRIDSSTVGTKLRMDCDGSGHWVTLANGTRTVT